MGNKKKLFGVVCPVHGRVSYAYTQLRNHQRVPAYLFALLCSPLYDEAWKFVYTWLKMNENDRIYLFVSWNCRWGSILFDKDNLRGWCPWNRCCWSCSAERRVLPAQPSTGCMAWTCLLALTAMMVHSLKSMYGFTLAFFCFSLFHLPEVHSSMFVHADLHLQKENMTKNPAATSLASGGRAPARYVYQFILACRVEAHL